MPVEVTGIMFRGFDLLADTIEAGRELIPRLKAAALDHDRASVASPAYV